MASYGVDRSAAGEALVEAEIQDDGCTHLRLVWLAAGGEIAPSSGSTPPPTRPRSGGTGGGTNEGEA